MFFGLDAPASALPGGRKHGPKPYKFIGFGDMHDPKAYKFIRFGDMHDPKPCKFIGFGDMHGPKSCIIISAGAEGRDPPRIRRGFGRAAGVSFGPGTLG